VARAQRAQRSPTVLPENVVKGDLISLSWTDEDLSCIRSGRVAVVEQWKETVEYRTKSGMVLFTTHGYGVTSPANIEIKVIERELPAQPALFVI